MKAWKKICMFVASAVILLGFLVYMSQFRYPCVKKGIRMAEAQRIADTQPGYFIITTVHYNTGAQFMIAYGEHEGTPVRLTGNDPLSALGMTFFVVDADSNYCLVHGEEQNKENMGIDYYQYPQYETKDPECMYTIDVTGWEIVMPIRRHTGHGRLLAPFWCIDTFDVEHGAKIEQP